MKRIAQTLLALFITTNVIAQTNFNTVNAVIGDASYVQTFEQAPNENTNEILRLQTHLSYVEELLSQKDVSHLSDEQKTNRSYILQTLHQYWTNGVFTKKL